MRFYGSELAWKDTRSCPAPESTSDSWRALLAAEESSLGRSHRWRWWAYNTGYIARETGHKTEKMLEEKHIVEVDVCYRVSRSILPWASPETWGAAQYSLHKAQRLRPIRPVRHQNSAPALGTPHLHTNTVSLYDSQRGYLGYLYACGCRCSYQCR